MDRQRGFTLLEMAIVLAILGLLTAFAIQGVGAQRTNAGLAENRTKQDTFKKALVSYISRNNRFPCPAIETLPPGAAGYGAEAATPGTCTGTTAAGTAMRGVVPWLALGLPDETALDGFDQRFTYLVDLNATNLTANSIQGLQGTITVHNATPITLGPPALGGNQINACPPPVPAGTNPCNLFAVAAVISHGPNGSGAFMPSGARLPLPAGTNEGENTDPDQNITQTQFIGNPGAASGVYDDTVLWLTPDDVLAPLVADGSLRTVPGALSQASSIVADAIIGATIASQAGGAPGAYIYTVPAVVPAGVPLTDPWGVDIVYARDLGVTTINATTLPPASGNAFTLASNGADGAPGTGDEPLPYTMSFLQLQGILGRTGF